MIDTNLTRDQFVDEAVRASAAALASTGRSLVAVPTTGARMEIAARIVEALGAELGRPARALFVQDRETVIEEARAAIARTTGVETSLVKGRRNDWHGQIVLASAKTLESEERRQDIGDFDIVLSTEAETGINRTYAAIVADARRRNPAVRVAGLTSSPERPDGVSLEPAFGPIAYRRFWSEMIDAGALVPPRALSVDTGLNLELEALRSDGLDFDQRQARGVLDRPDVNNRIVEQWQARGEGRPTVAFCTEIEHADNLADAFSKAGIKAAAIHSGLTPAEQRQRRRAFDEGQLDVLTNCMMLTEGAGLTRASCAIIARPMLHSTTFGQAIGLVMQPDGAKRDALVLDFAGAAVRHQKLDERSIVPTGEIRALSPTSAGPRRARHIVDDLEALDQAALPPLELAEIGFDRAPVPYEAIAGAHNTFVAANETAFAAVIQRSGRWLAVCAPHGGEPQVVHSGSVESAVAAGNAYMAAMPDGRTLNEQLALLKVPATADERAALWSANLVDLATRNDISRHVARVNLAWTAARDGATRSINQAIGGRIAGPSAPHIDLDATAILDRLNADKPLLPFRAVEPYSDVFIAAGDRSFAVITKNNDHWTAVLGAEDGRPVALTASHRYRDPLGRLVTLARAHLDQSENDRAALTSRKRSLATHDELARLRAAGTPLTGRRPSAYDAHAQDTYLRHERPVLLALAAVRNAERTHAEERSAAPLAQTPGPLPWTRIAGRPDVHVAVGPLALVAVVIEDGAIGVLATRQGLDWHAQRLPIRDAFEHANNIAQSYGGAANVDHRNLADLPAAASVRETLTQTFPDIADMADLSVSAASAHRAWATNTVPLREALREAMPIDTADRLLSGGIAQEPMVAAAPVPTIDHPDAPGFIAVDRAGGALVALQRGRHVVARETEGGWDLLQGERAEPPVIIRGLNHDAMIAAAAHFLPAESRPDEAALSKRAGLEDRHVLHRAGLVDLSMRADLTEHEANAHRIWLLRKDQLLVPAPNRIEDLVQEPTKRSLPPIGRPPRARTGTSI